VWTHPCLEVRPSPIAGHGLFATTAIDADVVVIRLGGHLVSTTDLHQLFADTSPDNYVDTFAVGDDLHIVLPAGTVAHYANHHCDPTMWPVATYELATRRVVNAHEELTMDYGLISDDPTFRMKCSCRAATCRGLITGEDWQIPELHERYAGHWPPGLQRRVGAVQPPGSATPVS